MELSWTSDHGLPHSELLSWNPEDRAKLVAYLMESSSKCQLCGTSSWEWEDDRNAYEPVANQCWGCYVRDGAEQDSDSMPGSRVVLVPRKQAEELNFRRSAAPKFSEE